MTLRGRDIVCIGFSDWHTDLLTNQQHLLVRAAKENRVLFGESLGLRRPQLAARDLRRIGRRLASALEPVREVDGLHVLSPLVLPLHSNELLRTLNAALLRQYVGRTVAKLKLRDLLLWSFVPQAEALIDLLEPAQILYYIDDDHAAKAGIDAASSGQWPLKDREPCPLETTVPGILAAGDIRAGSTKRVGFAVGDGSLAVTCVHKLTAIRK